MDNVWYTGMSTVNLRKVYHLGMFTTCIGASMYKDCNYSHSFIHLLFHLATLFECRHFVLLAVKVPASGGCSYVPNVPMQCAKFYSKSTVAVVCVIILSP